LEPKAGEVCVVNGAAGAVGSLVGQLAKLKVTIFIRFCSIILFFLGFNCHWFCWFR